MNQELKDSILRTGTTILGIVCKNGIVIAADRQSTAGTIVMNKKSEKVVEINDYLIFAGTGGVSDIQKLKKITAAELRLKELRSRSRPTVKQSANLMSTITYSQVRQMSSIPNIVGSLIGGFNEDGTTELYTIDPAGAIVMVENYDANFGSGMPYVLGLLERQYKKDINVKEGIELAIEAIKSATQRDIGSGHGIDVFTITKDGIKKVVEQEIISEYKDSKKQ
ncbi:MAG TPA: proteasome subunit beta [Bacillota bacterium]|nr:proteasome subunit beta [Bacillota bacterium]